MHPKVVKLRTRNVASSMENRSLLFQNTIYKENSLLLGKGIGILLFFL